MQYHAIRFVPLSVGLLPPVRSAVRSGSQLSVSEPSTTVDSSSTSQPQEDDDATLLKRALQRPKPLAVLGTSDSLSYQTPMLDFVARDYTRQVEYPPEPPPVSSVGVWFSGIAGTVSVLLGLGSLLMAAVANEVHLGTRFLAGLIGTALSVGGVLLPTKVYQHYKKQQKERAAYVPQPILYTVPNKTQNWINRSMVQMMELTNIRATLGEGSKALKASTGDTFAKQLSRRESRLLAEETQALQEMHNRQMEAKAEEALEAANATAEYTAQVANQTNPYYPFNLLG